MALSKKTLEYRKQNGICYDCGKPAVPGNRRCAMCLHKSVLSAREYKAKHRHEIRQYRRRERQKRLQSGCCPDCGAPVEDTQYKLCVNCRYRYRREKARANHTAASPEQF